MSWLKSACVFPCAFYRAHKRTHCKRNKYPIYYLHILQRKVTNVFTVKLMVTHSPLHPASPTYTNYYGKDKNYIPSEPYNTRSVKRISKTVRYCSEFLYPLMPYPAVMLSSHINIIYYKRHIKRIVPKSETRGFDRCLTSSHSLKSD